ncbi:hypothetical protein A3I46_01205 [Candidatus Kaiserbacteria bacterium RIFCSPLOWO2_02_FULL_54_13]|uniref:Uncharacterized protein n=1 Tax=Candidatus Kaiserbacteria bacterium RIFCSPHIGHO2_02_FULL_54_22 TaxID=1798495 RepID=A0A1F6DJ21_9BACT|nr:MAG: hypothetical protein A3C19_01700 [Candidatus Kaiserbacteria bacterium RIFCSPHIGHO2_02_FULL_54_22]OGG68552.1 MAG: hypothetical protein A3E99_00210 [Candidatus Kaiserbacteria bacterium RIFCSPHIGHO2_12_FULL_54_16]OGG83953.1 MAG: hypothetical protein A3I46_01205 [Candidatus Kaiserbacteria bacterium RIFCSPLOWO2_02_FULL_54_13]OGG89918.1 MAG: hypothetical protein A3G12_01595 [Candidatus Kaiserbacteria bacterium RIFCSPLOWO2_12_FULL_54_10]
MQTNPNSLSTAVRKLATATREMAWLLWEAVFYYCWVKPGFHRRSRERKLNDPEVLAVYREILTGLREGKVRHPTRKVSDILVALYGKKLTLRALGTTVAELRSFAPDYVDRSAGEPWLKDG